MDRLSAPSIVRRCIEKGFRVIELGLDLGYVIPGSINKASIEELITIRDAEKISYTVHLPLWSVEPASPNEFIRKASVEVLADAVKLCEPLEPEVYVVHATGALAAEFSRLEVGDFYREFIGNQMASIAEKSMQELLSRTSLEPKRLAIETVEFPFKLMRRIIDKLDVSMCFDTGHLLAGYPGIYPFMDFLEENFDRMANIHFHDGYREEKGKGIRIVRDHLTLGKGKLPVASMLEFLERNKYSHPLIFELTMAEALESLKVIEREYPKALSGK
ncbi:MAG: cobamide remodeling phosphodiesterase CbiR [Promethearchaeati archaeon SRVP18_Atabeyarchaeia-1]